MFGRGNKVVILELQFSQDGTNHSEISQQTYWQLIGVYLLALRGTNLSVILITKNTNNTLFSDNKPWTYSIIS
jgi:hypothetical protein